MDFLQVDVFAERAYMGNPLAVFPPGPELRTDQMQAIAREMNLSETVFVTDVDRDSYDVRIFTPGSELPFAGHPTIGTAFALWHSDLLRDDVVRQRSAAGETIVRREGEVIWFERPGVVQQDLERREPDAERKLAAALGLTERDVGLEARELGRSARLRPALADAGVPVLLIPLRDVAVLESCAPRADLLVRPETDGVYCVTAFRAGGLRARGFFPALGITEDPATGSAAAALGLYLADRIGDIEAEVVQGVEIGRRSLMHLHATKGRVRIGGRCEHVLDGRLQTLP